MLPSLRQLEYIVTLADTGQFVAAAKQCAVSQPALSKQIREVEESLGLVLFERTRPKVIPTPAGQKIVSRARQILLQTKELVSAAHALAGQHQDTLHLGVIPTIAPYGLPGLLAKLRKLYPQVAFVIHELQTDVLLSHLRDGTIDLGLLAQDFDPQGLCGPNLVEEPFVFVAPIDHELSSQGEIDLEEIAEANLILMEDGHCLRDQTLDLCAMAKHTYPTSVNAASVATLARMVESGLGVTLLPASALHAEVRSGQGLIARSFGPKAPGRIITLQWRTTSPNSSWFLEVGDVLKEHYLSLNHHIPEIEGAAPLIRAVDSP